MFVKLSCKIADRLEHCGIISKSNRTLYEYGLRQMFATILNILTMLLIGFIMGLAVPAMVYTIAYIPWKYMPEAIMLLHRSDAGHFLR